MEDYERLLMDLKRLLWNDLAELNGTEVMEMPSEEFKVYMRRRDSVTRLYSAVDDFLSHLNNHWA